MSSDLDCTQLLKELASQVHVRLSLGFLFKIQLEQGLTL